jgi:hypothetical protein
MRCRQLPACRLIVKSAAIAACLAAGACADKQRSIIGQSPYEAWSCDQLNREVARTDAAFTRGQKNTVEQAMAAKNCIHPLAAETE